MSEVGPGLGTPLIILRGTVTLNQLTITGGVPSITDSLGSGIFINRATVILNGSTVTGNGTFRFGGGIYNDLGHGDPEHRPLSGNTAIEVGGGIFNGGGTVTLNGNSTVRGNTARDQYAALVPVIERVSGAEHPDTLTTRANLARWTRQADSSTST